MPAREPHTAGAQTICRGRGSYRLPRVGSCQGRRLWRACGPPTVRKPCLTVATTLGRRISAICAPDICGKCALRRCSLSTLIYSLCLTNGESDPFSAGMVYLLHSRHGQERGVSRGLGAGRRSWELAAANWRVVRRSKRNECVVRTDLRIRLETNDNACAVCGSAVSLRPPLARKMRWTGRCRATGANRPGWR